MLNFDTPPPSSMGSTKDANSNWVTSGTPRAASISPAAASDPARLPERRSKASAKASGTAAPSAGGQAAGAQRQGDARQQRRAGGQRRRAVRLGHGAEQQQRQILSHGGPAGARGIRAGGRIAQPDRAQHGPVQQGPSRRGQRDGEHGRDQSPAPWPRVRGGCRQGAVAQARAVRVAGAVAGVAGVPGGQAAAQAQRQCQVDRHRQRDALQRQPGLRDDGVDDGHQFLVADGDRQRAVLHQGQALVGVGRQRDPGGVGRDHQPQHAARRQPQGLAGLDQADRHGAHGRAHDVGDVGRVEDHEAYRQGREFDAGLPAALESQAAPDGQVDLHGGQQGPRREGRGQRAVPRRVAPAAPGAPAQRQRRQGRGRVRQPAVHGRQGQPAVREQYGRQRRPGLPQVRQAQQQAVPDE
jgi:hypothetical protein